MPSHSHGITDPGHNHGYSGYSEEQAGITLSKFKDDFEEVGKDTTFGKYNDQIKNIKLP